MITHSNLFAAACSVSGVSDLISFQGQIVRDGISNQGFVETGQIRMAASLWQKPELYIANSPIFSVDKITTPILLMHNTIDEGVPFSQAIEFFTALRRLQKPSWLLEYAEGNHYVSGKSSTDFTIRMQQFFDYYLKDSLPPEWMTKGRPARLKGVDDRLRLDTSGRRPGPGLLTEEEKKKINNYSKIPLKEKLRRTEP